MKYTILSFYFILTFNSSMAQEIDSTFFIEDSIEVHMTTQYLNKAWRPTSKEKSYYYIYILQFNNVPYEPIVYDYKKCILKTDLNTDSIKEGHPVLLDGDYFWYNKKNKLIGEHHFSKGQAIGIEKNIRNYFWFLFHYVRICEEVDYNKKYKNSTFGYYYKEYRINGKVKFEGYYRNGDQGISIYEYDY